MPFYNNYSLSLGIVIPSFCIKLLNKKIIPGVELILCGI